VGNARRRLISIPTVVTAAVVLTVTLPLWLPAAALVDVVRLKWRLPIARLLLFAVGWAWLESIGVTIAGLLWLSGQRSHRGRHYRLQRWWAASVMRTLQTTTGIDVAVTGAEAFSSGPTIMLCRHASLADSLVSAWVITSLARRQPRYVLKRELLGDPCLDVVGHRVPNYFLDRGAADSSVELAAVTALSTGMTADDVAVIFPEGTRASATKRTRAIERIAERDPARAARLGNLQHLLPPRPAGSAALLAGCPQADVVLAWHIGFDGLDTFGGILRHLGRKPPLVQFVAKRVPRSEVPSGVEFAEWLDQQWLHIDNSVGLLLVANRSDHS
jgi:1-acyl-sn-glycerol-3-phosphate acyltransferase